MFEINRSIKFVLDFDTGEVLDSDSIFDKVNNPFEFRKEFNRNKHNIYCLECRQRLIVSNSRYDNLHFKHEPKSDFCLLKTSGLTLDEIAKINNIAYAKESERHKFLKNVIGSKLITVPGIDISSVRIDNKFIIKGAEKRRPDVYCRYFDKEIVFEIQLSALSQRYILSRYDFYRKHGIYLIWILDNFDVEGQSQTEQDIKHLEKHHNFFRLDENSEEFRLMCKFKYPFIKAENTIWSKWIDKSIRLKQLHFDSTEYKVFYFDYGYQHLKREEQRKRNLILKEEQKNKKQEEEKFNSAKIKSEKIIQNIKSLRQKKCYTFSNAIEAINNLDSFEMEVLNSELDLLNKRHKNEPVLNYWIRTAKKEDIGFVNFILETQKIKLDVNIINPNGNSAFIDIYQNNSLYKIVPIKLLFKRGYIYTDTDDKYLSSLTDENNLIANNRIIYKACNLVKDKKFIDNLFYHDKLIYIIESVKTDSIIHYNYKPNEWLAFANNAIQSYPYYWSYIRAAFKYYKLWEKLYQLDKKGTFKAKVENWNMNGPEQKWDFDNVFKYLYPEITIN